MSLVFGHKSDAYLRLKMINADAVRRRRLSVIHTGNALMEVIHLQSERRSRFRAIHLKLSVSRRPAFMGWRLAGTLTLLFRSVQKRSYTRKTARSARNRIFGLLRWPA